MGFNFLYDDGTNWPFRFKVEEETNKSQYEFLELYSHIMYDVLPNMTSEGFQQAGLTDPNSQIVFAVDDFDPYEDRFSPADAGQEGQDLVVSSLDPARVCLWAERWIETISSTSPEKREEMLPLSQHGGGSARVLEDLHYLIRQSKCAMRHGVSLRLHYSW